QGGVVGTLMTNFGFERAVAELGIPFIRAKVGDRYVMAELEKNDWKIGGESSGHIVCLDKTTTGDGIISALQILYAMSQSGLRLADLKQGMTKMPQTMINVKLGQKANPAEHDDVREAVSNVEQKLGDRGRVLLRPSGTEPVIRVMVEGENAETVAALCQQIADVIRKVAV
ncbi:MAG TPA: phosphoglucosamine mutase, partial [Pseudomonadales bacterium]|nr:phosphoglucosamine mutase [Pseudomonadales bacterium]